MPLLHHKSSILAPHTILLKSLVLHILTKEKNPSWLRQLML